MIKSRLVLISDTHTIPPAPPTHTSNPYRHPLPPANILIHAGDITKVGLKHEHLSMLSMLKSHPAELKLIIAGNHDITLDEEYYARIGHYRHRYRTDHTASSAKARRDKYSHLHSHSHFLGGEEEEEEEEEEEGPLESPAEIKALYTNDNARKAGIRYLDEGTETFRLSTGAKFTVYASPYTPEFCQWAFAYPRKTDRFNPPPSLPPPHGPGQGGATAAGREGGGGGGPSSPVPDYPGVDIMITHGPPYGILDQVAGRDESVGCEHLYRATERAKPRLHVFGHIHEGYGAQRVEWRTRGSSVIRSDRETTLEERCAYLDVSSESRFPLRREEETLFVNASVVTVRYEGVNAPWVVDMDLPVGE